jgi:pentatricopeptide repeat protein
MTRFLSVSTVVAVLAVGNGFFVPSFVGTRNARFPSPLKINEGRGLSSSPELNVTSSKIIDHVEGDAGERRANSTKQEFTRYEGNRAYSVGVANEEARASFLDACKYVRAARTNRDIDRWIFDMISNNPAIFNRWRIKAHIDFVKLLQDKQAYGAVSIFLQKIEKADVKVYTTAMFGFALSISHRHLALEVLNLMDERGVDPTSLTFIAVLGSVDGAKAVSSLMKRIESYSKVELTDEVFNSAIFACKRRGSDGETSRNWQTALNLFQIMRRKRIDPTIKTYHALLQVLGGTGQVHMAKSLLQQLHNTAGLVADNRVWAAAINICADRGDCDGALHFVREMNARGHRPNLLVCSVLLKAFALGARDELALQALDMMVRRDGSGSSDDGLSSYSFHLPPVLPDRIALNTVISACAKAKNFAGALEVLARMKDGEFLDPENGQVVTPDIISYHSILKFCTEPIVAMRLVKEMRLSRRNRGGAVTPSSVTYAHAINACQQAESPSSELAAKLLKWALDDGVTPTVYMFAPAIWAAQKSGDRSAALNFFVRMTELGCNPNSVAYNGVISALCDNGDVDHAVLIFKEMKERGMCVNAPVFKVSWAVVEGTKTKSVAESFSLLCSALQSQYSPLTPLTSERNISNESSALWIALKRLLGLVGQ